MDAALREITDENRDAVLALRVAPGQERFVSSVRDSLHEASEYPDAFLWKLLIDERHQGRGYGAEVVRQIADLVRANGGTDLLTSYVPADGGPAGFYGRLGFVPTGEVDPHGEVVVRLTL